MSSCTSTGHQSPSIPDSSPTNHALAALSDAGSIITGWPEPVQRVQLLAESGLIAIPPQYVRPQAERPYLFETSPSTSKTWSPLPICSSKAQLSPVSPAAPPDDRLGQTDSENSVPDPGLTFQAGIPVLDLADLSKSEEHRKALLEVLKHACEEWGFFQVRNHGVPEAVLQDVKDVARHFFKLPIAEKQAYANDPVTYQGYGSRLGVSKEAVLDWGDYFFLHVLPHSARDMRKWPSNPSNWRDTMEEYSRHIALLSTRLLDTLSMSLGLQELRTLQDSFGEELDMGLRINYYPACPQPDLTLGLSSHSDPGGLTVLLQDESVSGLQVRSKNSAWVTVPPLPGALVVNLGDQMQILTNGKYRSVEHRVVVNNSFERLSLACFINPSNDTVVAPIQELIQQDEQPAYNAMTFKQYRSFIRNRGTNGKAHLESIASPTSSLKKYDPTH